MALKLCNLQKRKLFISLKFSTMKSLLITIAIITALFSSNSVTAQTSTKVETVKVWGNCGSCKKHIEKAAKSAGASTASWNEDTKELTLQYNNLKTSSGKIQQAIANAGYDTQDFKGNKTAYDKLDKCCQYDRKQDAASIPAKP